MLTSQTASHFLPFCKLPSPRKPTATTGSEISPKSSLFLLTEQGELHFGMSRYQFRALGWERHGGRLMPPCWEMGSPPASCSQTSSTPSGPNHGTFLHFHFSFPIAPTAHRHSGMAAEAGICEHTDVPTGVFGQKLHQRSERAGVCSEGTPQDVHLGAADAKSLLLPHVPAALLGWCSDASASHHNSSPGSMPG